MFPQDPMYDLLYKHEAERYRRAQAVEMMDVENKPFDVLKYDYWIYLDTQGDSIGYAWNRIRIAITQSTDSVWIHFVTNDSENSITIDSVILEHNLTSSPASYNLQQPRMTIYLGSTLNAGDTIYITVYYHGQVGQNGFVGEGMEFRTHYVHTQGEMYGTRRWLPSYDEPYEKVDTVVAHIVVDTPWYAVANGVLVNQFSFGGQNHYVWKESHPITPYLIVLAASNRWKVQEQTWNYGSINMPVYEWVDSSGSFLGELPDMLTYLSGVYGTYPFYDEKYSQVHIAEGFFSGAMENQTNTFTAYPSYTMIAVHEMGHQWWGDWVTCGTFDDVWLNEGFATYTEAVYIELTEGYSAYKDTIARNIGFSLYYADYPLYGTDFYDDGWPVIYDKGSAVLHMMRIRFRRIYGDTAVGDSMFFEALHYYGNQHAYSYATTEDFMNDLETFTGVDWDVFFQQWIYTPGHPRFQVYWGKRQVLGQWMMDLVINQVQNYSWGYYEMDYPIRIFMSGGGTVDTFIHLHGVYSDTFHIALSAEPIDISMDPEEDFIDEVVGITSNREPIPGFEITVKGNALNFTLPSDGWHHLRIYDVRGRMILNRRFRGRAFSTRFEYPAGVYIYSIKSESGKEFKGKFIR